METTRDEITAITDTLLDYCEHVDSADADAWVSLFCDDGIFEEGGTYTGHEELRTQVRRLLGMFAATAHHLSNVRVNLTGPDTAEARSYIYAWHELHNGEQFEIWGRYLDDLRRDDGLWRFAHRRVEIFGSKGIDVGLPRAERADTSEW